jgi:hypothetical protein
VTTIPVGAPGAVVSIVTEAPLLSAPTFPATSVSRASIV